MSDPAPEPPDPGSAPSTHLFKRWVHVREEDHDGVAVYRPAGSDLPPARGRDEIEFRPDGSFVDHPIGRGDAPDDRPGTWSRRADGALEVSTEAGAQRVLHPTLVTADRLEVAVSSA